MFKDLYEKQIENQRELLKLNQYDSESTEIPVDDIKLFQYHTTQLMSEIGEVLAADKRWKSMRNSKYDKANKLNELADCYIVLMNMTMFSGFSADDILHEIDKKLTTFKRRIEKEKK